MIPKNIETSYGKFRTIIHFEQYWEDRIRKSYQKGFDDGFKFKEEIHELEED